MATSTASRVDHVTAQDDVHRLRTDEVETAHYVVTRANEVLIDDEWEGSSRTAEDDAAFELASSSLAGNSDRDEYMKEVREHLTLDTVKSATKCDSIIATEAECGSSGRTDGKEDEMVWIGMGRIDRRSAQGGAKDRLRGGNRCGYGGVRCAPVSEDETTGT